MEILTYNKLVQDYVYSLMNVFCAKNPDQLQDSFKELYAFKNIVEEAHAMSQIKEIAKNIEPKVLESNIIPKILDSTNSTFDMLYNEIPFNQILGKMHAELDEYKKLMENQ